MKSSRLSLLLLIFVVGCTSGPRGLPPTNDVSNFGKINDKLYRGAQPDQLGVEGLRRVGIKTIVNLRMPNDVWGAEAAEARANGMIYTNVPMRGLGRPTDVQVADVLAIIETLPSPVFIHCEHGCDRTGTVIACYRIQHDPWTSTKALSEAVQYGMSKWEVGMKRFVIDYEKFYRSN